MDDDRDLRAVAEVHRIDGSDDLDFERLTILLNRMNPLFKCEICLQDQFLWKLADNDGTAACLPFYNLRSPSRAIGVRYFIEFMCMTCGNTKLLDRKFLEARLANEG